LRFGASRKIVDYNRLGGQSKLDRGRGGGEKGEVTSTEVTAVHRKPAQ